MPEIVPYNCGCTCSGVIVPQLCWPPMHAPFADPDDDAMMDDLALAFETQFGFPILRRPDDDGGDDGPPDGPPGGGGPPGDGGGGGGHVPPTGVPGDISDPPGDGGGDPPGGGGGGGGGHVPPTGSPVGVGGF